MASVAVKRKVVEAFQPKQKKPRLKGKGRNLKANGSSQSKDEVDIDDLPWQQVSLPDRMDDAEGFFGLEEIDDVQVIKNGPSGRPLYKTVGKSLKANGPSSTFEEIAEESAASPIPESSTGSEPAWEGFEDADQAQSVSCNDLEPEIERLKVPAKRIKSEKLAAAERKVVKKAAQPHTQGVLSASNGNPFDALGTAGEGEESDVSAWQNIGLSPTVLSCLAKLRFSKPTPIQEASIPQVLSGHDVIGKASTGSGKTLAFGIPILEHFLVAQSEKSVHSPSEVEHPPPLALILSPTRELAHQLSSHLNNLCNGVSGASPRIVTVTGGLSTHKQQRQLLTADIIIGTPGRLWETISEGHGLLEKVKKIKFLVVDEADRLLSEGHFKEVEEILDSLDREQTAEKSSLPDQDNQSKSDNPTSQRQTLVFSATFQRELQQKLAGKGKFKRSATLLSNEQSMDYLLQKLNFREESPKFIDVNPVSQMAANLKEGIVECPALEKDLYLYTLLLLPPPQRTLIFTNSISSVRRLHPLLTLLNISSLPLHSQMPQKSRLRSVERFSSSTHPARVLIATDVAARGLDIPNVQLVVHYHVPRAADAYVHRSGRTARAGLNGKSLLLCAPEEVKGVRGLVARVHARSSASEGKKGKFYMRTVEPDKNLVERLKPRVTIAKKISEAGLVGEKRKIEDDWVKAAKEELGVESGDSEDGTLGFGGKGGGRGRGKGRREREKKAGALSKSELGALRAELKSLLAKRVNVGVSEKYLTAGGVNVEALLEGNGGEFLGRVDGLDGMDD